MLKGIVREKGQLKLTVIDARSKNAFLKSHLPGAIHVDPYSPSFQLKLKGLPVNQPVIVYCRTFKRSGMVCSYLYESGFRNIIQLTDGFTGWKRNYLPLD